MTTATETIKTETEEVVDSPDIDFKPLVSLPLIDTSTLEENEEELVKLRAKLFRFEFTNDPPEWKERGVGEVKIMSNKVSGCYRVIMRRDKTHKICANHLIQQDMKLLPSAGSDRAWVYTVLADFTDEEPKKEQLAIRFRNAEIASKFKEEFEKCQKLLGQESTKGIVEKLEQLAVNEEDTPTNGTETEESVASKSTADQSKEPDQDTPAENDTATVPENNTA